MRPFHPEYARIVSKQKCTQTKQRRSKEEKHWSRWLLKATIFVFHFFSIGIMRVSLSSSHRRIQQSMLCAMRRNNEGECNKPHSTWHQTLQILLMWLTNRRKCYKKAIQFVKHSHNSLLKPSDNCHFGRFLLLSFFQFILVPPLE